MSVRAKSRSPCKDILLEKSQKNDINLAPNGNKAEKWIDIFKMPANHIIRDYYL